MRVVRRRLWTSSYGSPDVEGTRSDISNPRKAAVRVLHVLAGSSSAMAGTADRQRSRDYDGAERGPRGRARYVVRRMGVDGSARTGCDVPTEAGYRVRMTRRVTSSWSMLSSPPPSLWNSK